MRLPDIPFEPIGDQPAFEPDALERFVAAPRIAVLAYTRADGTPNQIPIWYVYKDGRFYMECFANAPRVRAFQRRPQACLTIQDETPPYRAVIIDGDVTVSDRPEQGSPAEGIAVRYFGRYGAAEYEKMIAEDVAKIGIKLLTFEPRRVRGFDNHRMLAAPLRLYMRVRNMLPIPREWI